jgi:hypothetical protein
MMSSILTSYSVWMDLRRYKIFRSIQLTEPGEKVAVQLMAVNKSCRLSRMVFLGAVDYQALKIECIKRDQWLQ